MMPLTGELARPCCAYCDAPTAASVLICGCLCLSCALLLGAALPDTTLTSAGAAPSLTIATAHVHPDEPSDPSDAAPAEVPPTEVR